jgi:hypothetical protein
MLAIIIKAKQCSITMMAKEVRQSNQEYCVQGIQYQVKCKYLNAPLPLNPGWLLVPACYTCLPSLNTIHWRNKVGTSNRLATQMIKLPYTQLDMYMYMQGFI